MCGTEIMTDKLSIIHKLRSLKCKARLQTRTLPTRCKCIQYKKDHLRLKGVFIVIEYENRFFCRDFCLELPLQKLIY